MRTWVTVAVIAVAVLLALMPIVAHVIDRQTTVSGPQMVADMKTLGRVVQEMGPAYKNVDVSVAPNRSRIIVAGTVGSEDDRNRLRSALKAAPIKASLSRVTFDVGVKK
jgi:hypothetical protein